MTKEMLGTIKKKSQNNFFLIMLCYHSKVNIIILRFTSKLYSVLPTINCARIKLTQTPRQTKDENIIIRKLHINFPTSFKL